MNFSMSWRDKRTFLAPPHYPFAGYSMDTKTDMKNTFGDELFLNNLCLGPDPLRKNLADTIITEEKMATRNSKNKLEKEVEVEDNTHIHEDHSPLSGITSFLSGVMNVISNAMFSKRKPADFNTTSEPEMAVPSMWHGAKDSDENKIVEDKNLSDDMSSEIFASEMSDCRTAAAQCKNKLEQVRVLLGSNKPVTSPSRLRRRPRKVFVEPNSVEDCFEDAFSPEDFENLVSDSCIAFTSPVCYHERVYHEIDGPRIKVESAMPKVLPEWPKEVPRPPSAWADIPTAVPELPKVTPQAPKVVPEKSKVVPETSKMFLETIKVVPEPPKVIPEKLETSKVVSEFPKYIHEQSKVAPKVVPETLKEVSPKVSETSEIVTENLNDLCHNSSELAKIYVPLNEIDVPLVCESTEIVKNVPEVTTNSKLEMETKKELVESCEDKITKLKLLLQERRKKSKVVTDPLSEIKPVTLPLLNLQPEFNPLVTLPPRPKPSSKVKDKRYKNPNRCCDKRRKSRMNKNIHDDMLFANEIHSDNLSSVENSPSTNNMESYMEILHKTALNPKTINRSDPKPVPQKEYFDEVSGRFHSASVESDDSFQIVFNDSPKVRLSSDCESEDSFIIFEDSPDSCYTSNDVFGDSTDSEDYDSDSDVSDSGCGTLKMSASLSKSVGNLADDSLYEDHSEDEVDCANVKDFALCKRMTVSDNSDSGDAKGLLLNERKKLLRKDTPAKKVHFSPHPPKVHVMRVWLFAAKQTRLRYWEQFVTDRERFKRRIADVDMAVSWVLKPQHRSRVMFQRFMPWWNAQKRKEIAEKKEREAQEKLKEEERLRNEEIERQKAELDNENQDKTEEQNNSELSEEKKSNTEDKIPKQEESFIDTNSLEDTNKKNTNAPTKNLRDSPGINEIICQNSKETSKLNEMDRESDNLLENTKNNSKSADEKLYSDQIVPYNEKIMDLQDEYVGSILHT